MAKVYTKGSTVVDEVLSGAERYDIKDNGGTPIESNVQINLATSVAVAGTTINAARLNNIETGIDTLDTKVADANDLLTTGGTTTAYTLTTIGAAALATGERFRVKFNATAGATPTLNRDSKGAKSLKYYDNTGAKQACTSSNIVANLISDVVYDGTDYVVLDPAGVGGSSTGGTPVARVIATGNVTIASALENGDTLNGVTLVTGDTVLLAFQTTAADNGLYTVPASGAASRHSSYATWASLVGLTVAVSEGTVFADTLWMCKANASGTLGSTAVNFKPMFTQEWSAEYATYSSFADSGGTVIPYDDTIPQVTEGSQILTLTFTPVSDTIEIETGVPISFGVNDGRATVAIFKDGASNAIAASAAFISNSYLVGAPVICKKRVTSLTPGTQVVITVRVGPNTSNGTMYVNGNSVARKYGGVSSAYLKVREVNAGA